MRASAFARLQASMAGIPVTITSEPRSPVAQGFRPAVLLDLAWLQTQPVGAEPEEWMWRPPAIGLAHELVHAWRLMTGTRATPSTKSKPSGSEFSDEAFTENRFREAFGLTARPRVE